MKQMDKEELNAEEWSLILDKFNDAISSVDKFRIQEGKALKKDILENVQNIEKKLSLLSEFEKDRITNIRQRLQSGLNDIMEADKVDTNRFEQELIYYIEKLDINEEKVRLKNHCSFFKEVCSNNDASGKKLGFISQEMGREINTLGSKANHSEIQKIVVGMKDDLEKIKEQTLNIL
jgi:uncharacterized protein (TIGR00255 family)